MKRKLLKAFTILLAILCAFTAFAACNPKEKEDEGGTNTDVKQLAYELNADGQSYKVVGFKNEAFGTVEIPSSYEGKPVTVIAESAFSGGALKIRKIVVGENVEIIETKAFSGCKNLEEFSFAENSKIKTIQTEAFDNCSALHNVIIPESIEVIGERAFIYCQNIWLYFNTETLPENFADGWDLMNFDTYGKLTLTVKVFLKGEWSMVDGVPTANK